MDKQPPPSSRKLGRTGIIVVALLAAIAVITFVGMNIWHGTEVAEDEATGQTGATEHTPPNYVESNDAPEPDPGVPADLTQSDQPQP